MAPELTLYAQAEPAVLQPGSAAQEAYKQALVADLALSLGLNASLIEITAISSAMRRHLRLSPSPLVAGANGGGDGWAAGSGVPPQIDYRRRRHLQGGGGAAGQVSVEFSFIIRSDEPNVFASLSAQLADPTSALRTANTTGALNQGQSLDLSQGLQSFTYVCPGRLVLEAKSDTCVPCPAGAEYASRACVGCPVGRWSAEGGWCTACPPHRYTADHLRCHPCEAGSTVNVS
jgi:hypothetical protein